MTATGLRIHFRIHPRLRKAIFEQEKVRTSQVFCRFRQQPGQSYRFGSSRLKGPSECLGSWVHGKWEHPQDTTTSSARRYQILSHARIAPRHQGYRVEVRHPATSRQRILKNISCPTCLDPTSYLPCLFPSVPAARLPTQRLARNDPIADQANPGTNHTPRIDNFDQALQGGGTVV